MNKKFLLIIFLTYLSSGLIYSQKSCDNKAIISKNSGSDGAAAKSIGPHLLRTSGKNIINQNLDTILLRGMGLGGWMLQEGYMLQTSGFANAQYQIRAKIEDLIGSINTDTFYNAWLANHVRKVDIDSLKSWGFNSVRLPMHYNLFTMPIEDEPVPGQNTWLDKGFELTDSLISWCEQNEMYVILDLHAAPGGQGADQAISDYDPTKPSLWESQQNRDKTVALWKKMAERYADEQWVAGYDLLNETNWNLPGNTALKNLYLEITDSIRTVDSTHILFIEGNWFANDFSGLTPPWDNNIVYAPHKYWSYNDQASIQWVLDIRNQYNVPIWFGESGENSNTWFRDAIRLLEDHNIGWAWWPMKKVESISGPLSIAKSLEYQTILDYWNGLGATPTMAYAKSALMDFAEKHKIENCEYHKDVVDAMFRQVYSDETVPYNKQDIPGIVYSSDYSMGVIGEAYFDSVAATYQLSTGNFTAWNTGWEFRNDGVDIETCTDIMNSNGYAIGWLEKGEWMQYDVNVANSAVYDIQVRIASGSPGGKFHFSSGNADITSHSNLSSTGGWNNWATVFISGAVLYSSDEKIKFHVDHEGFNLNSFKFIETGPISSIATKYMAAVTVDHQSIQMNANKFIDTALPVAPGGFEISVNGNSVPITNISVDANNPRIIHFTLDYSLQYFETIKISYSGNQVLATDGTALSGFTLEDVKNMVDFAHPIPGKIEAEDFLVQSGVELETTSDVGGGQNIGYLDPGDYLDYEVHVNTTGVYNVDYRTAAQYGTGTLQLQVLDSAGNASTLQTVTFASTGGWQTWATNSGTAILTKGRHIFRILITQAPFNLNWFEFSLLYSMDNPNTDSFTRIQVSPNPGNGIYFLDAKLDVVQDVHIKIHTINGGLIYSKEFEKVSQFQDSISLSGFPDGSYFMIILLENGSFYTDKLLKICD
ncbi:MAG: carbohydrate-binding protein [Bacteroidales bacterium]|nr:carbohydrate-binding protein [Bacteroidales bacterium]MCF8454362.1 carbohydrate-binding protein [Bacteroidales bacterium]